MSEMERLPLRAQVARELLRLLRIGYFKPGSRMTEMAVAETLKVSRTPAREALSLLGESGVLQPLPFGGFIVPRLSSREIAELYEVRALLELPALRAAIEHRTPDICRTLREALQRLSDLRGDLETSDFMDSFLRFRELLFSECGNGVLERSIHRLDNQTEAMKARTVADPAVRERILVIYADLISAFEDGDADRAVRLLSEHHEEGRAYYEAVIRGLAQTGDGTE